MKKLTIILLTLLLTLAMAACASDTMPEPEEEPSNNFELEQDYDGANEGNSIQAPSSNRILIAYFTMPEPSGTDAVTGASRVVVGDEIIGNTQLIAQWIGDATDGALFQIETVQTYPSDHDELTAFADVEREEGARPALVLQLSDLDSYDVIFVGYPIWWADMPMALYSFFDAYDFSGKTIIPFSTHGGSGFARTIQAITALEPEAVVLENGLTISRNQVSEAQEAVTAWVDELDLFN